MSEAHLLCSRPHARYVDFKTSRFVVGIWRGLNVGGSHLEMGDEIPQGVLSPDALQREYEAPPRTIELLEYALTVPSLREACARRGVGTKATLSPDAVPGSPGSTPPPVDPPPPERPKSKAAEVEAMTKDEVLGYCKKHKLPVHGTYKQIRERILAHLEG